MQNVALLPAGVLAVPVELFVAINAGIAALLLSELIGELEALARITRW